MMNAELFDKDTGSFLYGSPLAVEPWVAPPSLRAYDGWLVWETSLEVFQRFGFADSEAFRDEALAEPREHEARVVSVAQGLNDWFQAWKPVSPPKTQDGWRRFLQDFVSLATAPDVAVVRFARRWGLLGVCQHLIVDCGLCSGQGPIGPQGHPDGRGREPVAGWRVCAAVASNVLLTAGRVTRPDQVPASTSWPPLGEPWPFASVPQPFTPRNARQAERELMGVLQGWLRITPMRLVLPTGGPPTLSISGPLFGVIGLQLTAAAFGSPGIFICDACYMPYFPKRVPKRGQGKYCKRAECQAESRNASRRLRASAMRGTNVEAS
jgi:hypothetical protein